MRESSLSSELNGVAPATIHLVLTGGPHAGTYDVDTKTRTCSHGLIRKRAWGHMFSDDGAKPSSVQLFIPGPGGSAADGETFSFRVTFGDPLTGPRYEIDRTQGARDGEGTATVTDRGSSATIRIVGTSRDGMGIDASIECREVHRVPDENW
ncbi:MAG: hypothetical protein M3125_03155 [Gemmatimonadota bacterium]|nr:hypothetical protein [Gemmatimonadota bacterium]